MKARLIAAVFCFCVSTPAMAQDYKAILASPDRIEADRSNDGKRKADQMLPFIAAKSGMRALDMAAGGGYTTELLARSVGEAGRIYAQAPRASDRLKQRLETPAMKNVTLLERPFDSPVPDDVKDLDLVTFFFNYHDTTFMEVDRARMNKAVFHALKSGGVYVIADHAAKPEDGISVGKTLHRIAEQSLRAEVEAAGFKLVGSADFLRNPNDPRTESSGKNSVPNDEFVLKFQKP
jgi:predicted methyltransferase